MEKKKFKERAKEHWQKHKTKYYVGGTLVVGVGAGYILRRHIGVAITNKSLNIQIAGSSNTIDNSIVNEYHKYVSRNGHAGNIIRCIETGEEWGSQNEAAKALGVSSTTVGRVVKDGTKLRNKTIEKVGSWNVDEQPKAS